MQCTPPRRFCSLCKEPYHYQLDCTRGEVAEAHNRYLRWQESGRAAHFEARHGHDADSAQQMEAFRTEQRKHEAKTREARERYLLQVLQERYHFSGQLHDVPRELIQFMSERAAGNPKYIMESLQALNDAEHLVFLPNGTHTRC